MKILKQDNCNRSVTKWVFLHNFVNDKDLPACASEQQKEVYFLNF